MRRASLPGAIPAVRGTCAALLAAAALMGCQKAAEESEPAPIATVGVEAASRHSIADTLSAYGVLDFAPAHTRSLTIQVESQVAERFVLPGSAVKAGDPLLRLVPSAASHLDVDKASRDASVAEAEAQRVDRLHEQGLATDSDLRVARAAAETAVALRNSLNSRIGSDGLTLRAPIAGIVDALTAQPGDVLPPGTLILRIADPDALYARVGVEAQDAVRVKAGQKVTLSSLTPGGTAFTGKVGEVDARIDPQSHLTTAVVRPDTGATALPGSAVQARIVVATHDDVVTVPRSAVLYANEQPFVFVATGSGKEAQKAQRRPVSVGFQDEARIEVVKGLTVGEVVVTSGNYELEDGMAVKDEAKP